ncbi:MAG: CDP-glucose 4,6-dehydratase [Granulosicoccus sp.]
MNPQTALPTSTFWKGKSVLVTGHTGFKGSWLSLWLAQLEAIVNGYALPPENRNSLFKLISDDDILSSSHLQDVRDLPGLLQVMRSCQPEIVFHLAAQALVRESYLNPVDTFSTNVMGTVNLLEAVGQIDSVRAVVIVTTDKCYENKEWPWPYRENDALGGHDPYSASKACAEIITQSWQSSQHSHQGGEGQASFVASARAGNVIGGGDWSADRLVPDVLSCIEARRPISLRNPSAVRPWQHVLDPLAGYLLLAEKLYEEGERWEGAWNFGPAETGNETVSKVVETLLHAMQSDCCWQTDCGAHPTETQLLRLDCSKARQQLQWTPRWTLAQAIDEVAGWHRAWLNNSDMRQYSRESIQRYMNERQESAR